MTTRFGGVALARTNLPSRGLSGRIATISVFWNLMFFLGRGTLGEGAKNCHA